MNTNHLRRTLSLGLWIAVGAFGCSSSTGNDPGSTSPETGGSTSSSSSSSTATNVGGSPGTGGNTQAGGAGGTSSSSHADTGGTTSANSTTGGNTTTTGTKTTGGTKAVGGSSSTGGKSNAGGTSSTGGSSTVGSGGKGNVGGMSSTGGTKASTGGVGPTGGTSSQTGTCSITVKNASYSSKIGSVGIVTWSTTLAGVDKAEIEFGVDTNYGMVAPVDLKQPDYRTVLLGMKQAHAPYHFRIKATAGGVECVGPDNVFTGNTAAKPNQVKLPTVTTKNKDALFGGFLVLEGYRLASSSGGASNDYAFVLDVDGDVVWWYGPNIGTLSVAKMTYDGKSIWIANDNVPESTAKVGRVRMDGEGWEDLSAQFPRFNHDLTVLPDETVIFIAYGSNKCDDIKERSPNGTVRTIVNSGKAFGNPSGGCHCNAIQYDPSDDTVIVSEDNFSGYFKTDRQGNIKWVLNGGNSNQFDKAGGGATGWVGNHNLHILGPDRLLFFNNGVAALQPGSKPAIAREIKLDLTNMTTSEVWKYESSPSISNAVMGDVQRLENGNTLVAYSTAGTIHEVGPDKSLLQALVWSGLGSAGFGYVTKRKTLYGAPPR